MRRCVDSFWRVQFVAEHPPSPPSSSSSIMSIAVRVKEELQNKYPNAIECQVIDNSNTSSSCDSGAAIAKLEVIIVTSAFDNISNIKRHREIQNLLQEKGLFQHIHALQIKAWTVEQYARMEKKVVYEI